MAEKKTTKKKKATAKEKALNKQIKERKKLKAQAAMPKDTSVDFDSWYAMRRPQIGKQHHKEVLQVYMKSIGLSNKETVERYDEALGIYGVKLK